MVSCHNYAEALWARGNCWITIAIPEIIEILELPKGDSLREFLLSTLNAQVAALAKYQDESGLWHTLINDSNSYLESSATAGFAYGILKAVHKKYISSEYEEVANKAIAGLLNEIDETGEVQHVSVGTGMGDNLDFYRTIGMTAMPYGQSLTILCLTELLVIARKVRRKVHEKKKGFIYSSYDIGRITVAKWLWQNRSFGK